MKYMKEFQVHMRVWVLCVTVGCMDSGCMCNRAEAKYVCGVSEVACGRQ